MELNIINLFLALGAGIASIASPCVLPVVPIIVTGTKNDHKHRPLLVVAGLSLSFIIMGIITSIFGSFIAGYMYYLEKIAAMIILIIGLLMIIDINPFKSVTAFSSLNTQHKGRFSGFFLGATLGLVWIPCIGPMLSGVLMKVATDGQVLSGIVMLIFYSIGFAIPMLIAGYSSHYFRSKTKILQKNPSLVRYVSGSILIAFGVYILYAGLLF
jgi:cytochrome c-type biogenesis protein